MSNRNNVSWSDMSPPVFFGPAFAQVKEVMIFEGKYDTVLSTAATSGSRDTFEAAVAALEKKLTPAEVMVAGHTSVVFHRVSYRVGRWRTP